MKMSPTNDQERVISLDIIRGFALLGILIANIVTFKSPFFQLQSMPMSFPNTPFESIDQWTAFFIDFFITGKFYPMFAFLFGIGFYLFYERVNQKKLDARRLYIRRMLFLLFIGIVHLVLFWTGDILHTYGVAGLLLLLFITRKNKVLITWAIVFIVGSALLIFLLTIAGNYAIILMQEDSFYKQEVGSLIESARQVYQGQNFIHLLAFRLQNEVSYIAFNLPFSLPNIVGLFLIGLVTARKSLIQHAEQYLPFWKKTWVLTLVSGGSLSLFYAMLKNGLSSFPVWLAEGMAEGLNILAGPLLMLFYVSTFVLFLQNKRIVRYCKPLAAVGKMALTNYLFQTVICMFVFYGFGLGLYEAVGLTTGVSIALAIFALQLCLSHFWLKKFDRGPMEKLWRLWTYR